MLSGTFFRPVQRMSRYLASGMMDLVLPPTCRFCSGPLDSFCSGPLDRSGRNRQADEYFCGRCLSELAVSETVMAQACWRCGMPAAGVAAASRPDKHLGSVGDRSGCQSCSGEQFEFDAVYALWMYRDRVCDAVVASKFVYNAPLAAALGTRLGRRLSTVFERPPSAGRPLKVPSRPSDLRLAPVDPVRINLDPINLASLDLTPGDLNPTHQSTAADGDWPLPTETTLAETLSTDSRPTEISYVPSHFFRQISRGGTGTQVIAQAIGDQMGIPMRQRLRSVRLTAKQAWLDDDARQQNTHGAFQIRKRHPFAKPAKLDNQHILLVDDVFTTGATACQAAGVLKSAGAARVTVAVISRAVRVR